MTHPTDEELEAMAARLSVKNGYVAPDFATPIADPLKLESAAMLRACKGRGADCVDTLRALSAERDALKEQVANLGRELNTAKYGQPDFAWSVHIAAMDALKAELAEAVELMRELADDLSVEVDARYPIADRNYPTIHNRYNRDISPVIRARAFVARHQKG